MRFNKGDNIGPYKVAFQHKKGSYAETYRVKDTNGKTRFLKLISHASLERHQIDENGNIVEVEISKRLSHHNLCSYLDTATIVINGGQYTYLVTEFISGETLSQKLIREEEIGVYDIKKIAKSVLSALDYLHNLPTPIVHGEVTIQNVMLNLVGGYDDLKLIDMGHARFVNQSPLKADINSLNPFYLAPERFSGVSQVQSDLYSVGVMIYHLLYDELPWFLDVSRIKGDVIDAILEKRKESLKILRTDIFELDEQLIACMIKALSFNVEDRFQTAQEFIQAIDGEIKLTISDVSQSSKPNNEAKAKPSEKCKYSRTVSGPGFAAIAGMDDLKQQMKDEVIEPLHNPEEYRRYGVTIPNGMLLYGPPGCGKTFFAKHFAEEVGFNFMQVTPATLKSKWINATQENIAKMFEEAESNAPTIIFIDELDDLLKDRALADDKGMSGINEFLAQMDRTGEKGIFIIGATNKPDILDPAVLRAGRLEKKYYLGVPDKSAREALFKLYLAKRPYDFGIDYGKLADLTENYVSADIQLIVNDASRAALKLRSKITMELLIQTIGTVKQSISNEELIRYDNIRAIMNGEKPQKSSRPKIGF
ncbi:MAG: AAA family ATPase [Alistipes sp.]|nr:AAA family ATPase [Alistipes sp.]